MSSRYCPNCHKVVVVPQTLPERLFLWSLAVLGLASAAVAVVALARAVFSW